MNNEELKNMTTAIEIMSSEKLSLFIELAIKELNQRKGDTNARVCHGTRVYF